jgi:hypothetical protein
MLTTLAALTLGLLVNVGQTGQYPLTTAEKSNFANTSSYEDVIGFLDQLQVNKAPIRISTIGKSTLGKEIPLVVCHKNPNITPFEAKRRGLPVVYLQANIHAGEVEGKEAVLILMRELAQNSKDPILSKLVLVVQPIYNSDGNDKWGTNARNRGHQDGPEPVGERANGAGLDLNRDCMKAESPEMQAVLKHVYNTWDPEVMMDLHTTNGTRHGYILTYSPCLNPTSDATVLGFTRDVLLPKIRKDTLAAKGWNLIDYGNAEKRDGKDVYATFGWEPRYVTNYAGTRNRIAVLSEAASFQPFKLRVESTLDFVRRVLSETIRNSKKVIDMTRGADERWAKMVRTIGGKRDVGIRFEMAQRGSEPVILEIERKQSEINQMKAPTKFRTVTTPVWDRFVSSRTARVPMAYLLPADATKAVSLLLAQGIAVERLREPWSGDAERFEVKEFKQASQAFQGHKLITLEGAFASVPFSVPAGSYVVRADQPLGLLGFHLLEPESLDGCAAWGLFGETFAVGSEFPVRKVFSPISAASRQIAMD